MIKLIKNIVAFSLKNRFFTFFWVAIMVVAGAVSYKNTAIEAFPDVTNTQIIIVTQWQGRSAQEVERFVSIPIEVAMNSVQRKTNVRPCLLEQVANRVGYRPPVPPAVQRGDQPKRIANRRKVRRQRLRNLERLKAAAEGMVILEQLFIADREQ